VLDYDHSCLCEVWPELLGSYWSLGPCLCWKKLKYCSGWFSTRKKYCSDWKNQLKSTDYKPTKLGPVSLGFFSCYARYGGWILLLLPYASVSLMVLVCAVTISCVAFPDGKGWNLVALLKKCMFALNNLQHCRYSMLTHLGWYLPYRQHLHIIIYIWRVWYHKNNVETATKLHVPPNSLSPFI
jgi:hypothetical protein